MINENNYNPLVSIITPNYNGEVFLENTIKSVVNQTYKNIEYIVIDGGSTDRSHEIIKKYKKYINYLEIQSDNGIFHAVHKGIKRSKGKYIIWINSDDVLSPRAAENVVTIFKKNPSLDWINGKCGYIKKNIQFSFIPYVYPKSIIEKGKAHKKFYGYIQQESTSFTKSLYLKSGGLDISSNSGGDYFLWKKFSKITNLKTYFINIGYFRSHNNQLSSNKDSFEIFTGHISSKYDLNLFRLLLSLIYLPLIIFKTFVTKYIK
tara:strand:- start:377 stop:1162 length:786 start_codon:yes stop_codon:yes gene_type:complete